MEENHDTLFSNLLHLIITLYKCITSLSTCYNYYMEHGNVLEVPCKYNVRGPKYMLTNIECMIKDYLGQTNCYSIHYIVNNFL